MKNLKIYKSALAILTATSILLLNGCSTSKNNEENKSETKGLNNHCSHLTVYFEEGPITFKECDGYEISAAIKQSYLRYDIQKDEQEIISKGYTSNYSYNIVDHSVTDEIIDIESIQKSK